MKNTFKLFLFALLATPLFFMTSCETNFETNCDDFGVSVDYTIAADSLSVTLTAVVSGGQPDFTYVWSTSETTESIVVTEEGTYSVTVTDANECTASVDFVLDFDPGVEDECDGFEASIAEDQGSQSSYLTASATGGTAPYSYIWSTGSTSNVIEVSTTGLYTVVIEDSEGCKTTASFNYTTTACGYNATIVPYPDTMSNMTTLVVEIDDQSAAPFTFAWNTGENSQAIAVTDEGEYTVVITDNVGCETEVSFYYSSPACVGFETIILVSEDPDSDKLVLTAETSGGDGVYTYLWSTGETTATILVDDQPGGYGVDVNDGNGCFTRAEIQL